MRHTSLRILLALVAINNMHLEHMDVKTTFIHCALNEMIVMEQPEGYLDPKRLDYVCHLKKSLYGFKQSRGNGTQGLTGLCLRTVFRDIPLIVVCIIRMWEMVVRFTCYCMLMT